MVLCSAMGLCSVMLCVVVVYIVLCVCVRCVICCVMSCCVCCVRCVVFVVCVVFSAVLFTRIGHQLYYATYTYRD